MENANNQPKKPGSKTFRKVFIAIHRYAGLTMAVFLVVAGLTGTLIAFYHELDTAINPTLMKVSPPSDGAALQDLFELREKLAQQLQGATIDGISFNQHPDEAAVFYVDWPEELEGHVLKDDTWFVDPYTAEILGSRTYGDLSQGVKNLMPFIYMLHYSLALGTVGGYIMGIIALIWTIDCFVGAYITFPPPSQTRRTAPEWLKRWKPSWLLNTSKLFATVFTFHRASGLWIWAVLFVFAWSSVGLMLSEVYDPVMKAVFGKEEYIYHTIDTLDEPMLVPPVSFKEAHELGKDYMEGLAADRGFEVESERGLRYYQTKGVYRYIVKSSLDIAERYPSTILFLNATTGELIGFEGPTGQNAGTTVTRWLYSLHFGDVKGLGLPYRIFVSMTGLIVICLSVTGVWIWWKKRKKKPNTKIKSGKKYKINISDINQTKPLVEETYS